MRAAYIILAIIGFFLPYYFFSSFVMENGLDVQLMFSQLFANDISTFFAIDLIITAVVFLIFSYQESKRCRMANWWGYLVGTLLVGPSFAFPSFLFFREPKIRKK